jgi:malonate transporter MadL subunit
MVFYGTALLAACLVAGLWLGTVAGRAFGIDSDIGGVGLGMLLLIGSTSWLSHRGLWPVVADRGVRYWGEIYIPVIVAMAATQNVRGSLSGGWVAILAGAGGVLASAVVCRLLIRLAAGAGASPALPPGDAP